MVQTVEMAEYQKSQNFSDFKSILESIGYSLIDCGDHWRTQALYRGGDNATAVKVYKNTGVWMDFVDHVGCKPFEALVKLTVKDERSAKNLIKNVKVDALNYKQSSRRKGIEMERVYPDDSLNKLFPNYNFYSGRSISEETQVSFKVGLAGVGKMYRRMVFPVYNENKQVIGFSGRKIDEGNDYPKWKHVGKKNGWVYPACIPEHDCDSEITEKREVVLVESIGDAMALYEQGVKNVLVIFGLSTGPNIISYLSSKSIDRIIISTNNDSGSSQNRGLVGAIKNYLKLLSYFDLDVISIKFPPKKANDFGEAHQNSYNLKEWVEKGVNKKEQRDYISKFVSNNSGFFSQKDIKKAKILNE